MKRLTLIVALLAMAVVGCAVDRADLASDEVVTFDQLKKGEAEAQRMLVEAQAAVDADPADVGAQADLLAAQGQYGAAEKALMDFETEIIRKRFGAFTSFATNIPVVGPWVGMLGPAFAGLIPLFGTRGRKHYAAAVMSLNPFSKTGTGGATVPGTQVAPLEALKSVGRAIGMLHSSSASEAAANSVA